MHVPEADEIDSEFQVLEADYADDDFYGGAFEGSHAFADLVVLRLYSVVPGDSLRVETRHHYAGQVVEHRRTTHELDDDRSVAGTDRSLEAFCRDHHFESSREELASLVATVEESDEYGFGE